MKPKGCLMWIFYFFVWLVSMSVIGGVLDKLRDKGIIFDGVFAFGMFVMFVTIPTLLLLTGLDKNTKKQKAEDNKKLQEMLESIRKNHALPEVETKGYFLDKGEKGHIFAEDVELMEPRAVRTSGGVGIKVMPGVYVGGSKGTSSQEWQVLDQGKLILTSERIIFDGPKEDRSIPLGDIVSFSKGEKESAIEISTKKRSKSMIFVVAGSELWEAGITYLRTGKV